MLRENEKKEMRADALSPERRQDFLLARQKRPEASRALNDYIAFLMAVQKIKPFEHKRVITKANKNIL